MEYCLVCGDEKCVQCDGNGCTECISEYEPYEIEEGRAECITEEEHELRERGEQQLR